jgi:hypothetical protein
MPEAADYRTNELSRRADKSGKIWYASHREAKGQGSE